MFLGIVYVVSISGMPFQVYCSDLEADQEAFKLNKEHPNLHAEVSSSSLYGSFQAVGTMKMVALSQSEKKGI